jgi:hypothetical protein
MQDMWARGPRGKAASYEPINELPAVAAAVSYGASLSHACTLVQSNVVYRRCKLSMGKRDFQGSADSKPLNRTTPNFGHMTTVLTSCYKSTFITIAPRGSSAQYGEVAHFVTPVFFTSSHEPSPERAVQFAKLMPQTTSFASRKSLLGSHR